MCAHNSIPPATMEFALSGHSLRVEWSVSTCLRTSIGMAAVMERLKEHISPAVE